MPEIRRVEWRIVGLVLAACGAATTPAPPAPPIRNFAQIDYMMLGPRDDPPNRLEIGPRGAMRLIRGRAGAGEAIGFFEGRLRPDEVRALARSLDEIDGLPDHGETIAAGEPARWLRVTWPDGTHVDKAVALGRSVDPRLTSILRRLDGCAQRAAAHPRQTVALALESVTAGPGRAVEAQIAVLAGGAAPLEFPRASDLARLRQLALRLEGATEAAVVEVDAATDAPVSIEPGGRLSIVARAVLPPGAPLPQHAAVVARFDGTLPPIAGVALSADAPVAAPTSSLGLAWPDRVCGAMSASPAALRVEACGCTERLWCEVREGPEPVLVVWEDLSATAICTACRLVVGTCALPGPLVTPVATLRVNDTIAIDVRPRPTGGLEPGECHDVARPAGLGRADQEAIAARLGGPRSPDL